MMCCVELMQVIAIAFYNVFFHKMHLFSSLNVVPGILKRVL